MTTSALPLLWWLPFSRHSERALRAYVFIEKCNVHAVGVGMRPLVRLSFKNTGQTPAYKCSYYGGVGCAVFPAAEIPRTRPQNFAVSNAVFPAGGVHHSEFRGPDVISAAEHREIMQGTAAIYLHGEIVYEDAFKKERSTRFCLFYGGDAGTPQTGAMASHREGNEAT
jgi:hypothetical protein